MTMRGLGLFIAIALSGAAAFPAFAFVAPQAEASLHRERALALSKLLQPRDVMLQALVGVVEKDVPAALARDPAAALMEHEYPGIIDAMMAAALPEITGPFEANLPSLWDRFADLYQERMTIDEIDAAYRFYSSPTGQKVVRTMHQSLDTRAILDDAMAGDSTAVSSEAIEQAQTGALAQFIATMTSEDRAALEALAKSPMIGKLQELGPEVQRLTMEFLNRPDPDGEARVQQVMHDAMTAFIAEADRANAGE